MQDFHPKFKPNFSVNVVAGDGVFLISENQTIALQGAAVEALALTMDGRTSAHEIASNLSPQFGFDEVIAIIERMLQQGVLADGPAADPATAFWHELGVNTEQLPRLLNAIPIAISSDKSTWKNDVSLILSSFGMKVEETGRFLVAVVDDYLDPILFQIDDYCRFNGIPWMPFKPSGINLWLGPIFIPHETACWSCVQSRLIRNRQAENYVLQRTGSLPTSISNATIPATYQQALNTLALTVARFITTGHSPLLNSLAVFRSLHTELTHHPVQRLPQCSACGNDKLAAIQTTEFELRDEVKRPGLDDGGERVQTPERTLRKYQHLVSPLTGVVKELVPNPWNDYGPIYSFTAGHNFALNDHWHSLQTHLRSNSGGKGRTETQAKTGALCEALERYSGRFQGQEVCLQASLNQLGEQGVHPNRCQLFSLKQYEERASWLARGGHFTDIPVEFDESKIIDWSPVYSYTHQTVRYLPTGYLYYGYPQIQTEAAFWADSNGAASGTTLTDATLQGFYEIVERDAVGIWWYNQIARPGVDLDSLDDPYLQELRDFYRNHNRDLWILDLTTDISIPVFVALSKRNDQPVEDIVFGFGAHLNARIAIHRAIAELNQFVPAVLNMDANGHTIYSYDDAEAQRFWRNATTTSQPYLAPLPGHQTRLQDYPDVSNMTLLDQVKHGFAIMQSMNMEVLLLNQSRADIGLPVARVIVPGMRHFWARYAPGRLYDVPVSMGWLSSPTPEALLNPISMFL